MLTGFPYYRDLNHKILAGRDVRYSQWIGQGTGRPNQRIEDRPLTYPRIGIYAGKGCSHSWLWFADLFERVGFFDLVFLDEDHIRAGGLRFLDCLAISGGDTIAMAEGLGREGAEELGSFLEKGGLYLGSCAGAYLPLNSSKEHLRDFNFVAAKITNLTKELPDSLQLPEKSLTPYGCSYIFHPVREAVELNAGSTPPFAGRGTFPAPLFGGPGMIPGRDSQVLACYSGFTSQTLFLVDPDLAKETLLGQAAVIRNPLGRGCLVLFGPHFEHPYFPTANQLVSDLIYWELSQTSRPKKPGDHRPSATTLTGAGLKKWIKGLKREISNSRIVANGLETLPIQWLIGNKIYQPLKVRFFLEASWTRLDWLANQPDLAVSEGEEKNLTEKAIQLTFLLRDLKNQIDAGQDTLPSAETLFKELQFFTRRFLNIYFKSQWSAFKPSRN
ncbi:MAG: hypothetical protein V2B13_04755 [Pseudomonadota bacterium]